MKLKCVKGNTYVLEAAEALIPFYGCFLFLF